MFNINDNILNAFIFKALDKDYLLRILMEMDLKISNYEKSSIIALEGDPCKHLAIINKGEVELTRSSHSGRSVILRHFYPGDIFGEAIIFSSSNSYPATITALTDCQIVYINKSNLVDLMANDQTILNNILGLLSNRILMLGDKISLLSLNSIDKKLSYFLLDQAKKKNSHSFFIPYNREQLAEFINVPRPSLSRVLGELKDKGLIKYSKNHFEILDPLGLEDLLYG